MKIEGFDFESHRNYMIDNEKYEIDFLTLDALEDYLLKGSNNYSIAFLSLIDIIKSIKINYEKTGRDFFDLMNELTLRDYDFFYSDSKIKYYFFKKVILEAEITCDTCKEVLKKTDKRSLILYGVEIMRVLLEELEEPEHLEL